MEFVWSNLPQTSYTSKLIFPLRNLFGVGSRNSIAPKKFKFSFGSPCTIGCQHIIIWFFLARKSITAVLDAILWKLLSISYEIACGLRWCGVNLRVSCPYLFFNYHFKFGFKQTPHWIHLSSTTSFLGKCTSPSFLGIYG